mmetsp:Transcript_19395/g.29776  ORF Transcript_19395/g.29776 Transcript_19395/m.29776 type:complete len:132 (+) Transcript_19395:900-1295(+)
MKKTARVTFVNQDHEDAVHIFKSNRNLRQTLLAKKNLRRSLNAGTIILNDKAEKEEQSIRYHLNLTKYSVFNQKNQGIVTGLSNEDYLSLPSTEKRYERISGPPADLENIRSGRRKKKEEDDAETKEKIMS